MCKCITKVEENAVGTGTSNGKIKSAEFLDFNLADGITFSNLNVTFENGKTKKMPMIHDYCPFCGKKYKKQ